MKLLSASKSTRAEPVEDYDKVGETCSVHHLSLNLIQHITFIVVYVTLL